MPRLARQLRDNDEHLEGRFTRAIERQTAKLPSDSFLIGAFTSIGAALALRIAGKKTASNFVGQWAPTILIMGLYNKLVKIGGSDHKSGRIH